MNPVFHIFKSIFPAVAMAFFLNACAAAVNWDYPRMPSKAFAHPETTSAPGSAYHVTLAAYILRVFG
jgi:hypothetical protein